MHQFRTGFTIIELITVVTITAIISVVAVAVLLNSQLRGSKSTAISLVRQEGVFVSDQLVFLLRNARYLEANQDGQTCTGGMDALRVRSADDVSVEIFRDPDTNRMVTNEGVLVDPPTNFITSPSVRVTSLQFDCSQRSAQEGARVGITFTIDTGDPLITPAESYYQQEFKTQVSIRSY